MDIEKIQAGVRMILEGVGEDPTREGLLDTPRRVAEMYDEIFAGLTQDPGEHFCVTFDEGQQEMVLVRDIPLYSVCEHHLLPFIGRAHVAYIPGKRTAASAGCRSSRASSTSSPSVRRCRSA